MLDKPIYKDWIFYLWLASIFAIVPGTLLSTYNGSGLGSFVIGSMFQSLFFLVAPSAIRSNLRNKKSGKNPGLVVKPMESEAKMFNPSGNSRGFESLNKKQGENNSLVPVRICIDCGKISYESWSPECKNCGGTSFFHEKREFIPEVVNPENKKCPMCAEDIKFEAKKCRFCQHMQDEIND